MDIPIPILSKIVSHDLHLNDIKSLRLVSKYFRDIFNTFYFQKIFYSYVYPGKYIDTGGDTVWYNLIKIHHIICNLPCNVSDKLDISSKKQQLCQMPSYLIDIYLKLIGVDIFTNRDKYENIRAYYMPHTRHIIIQNNSLSYLSSHLQLSVIEHYDLLLVKAPCIIAEMGAEVLVITPSRNFYIRIMNIFDNIQQQHPTYLQDEELHNVIPMHQSFINCFVKLFIKRLKSITDISAYLNAWKGWIQTMKLDILLREYLSIETPPIKNKTSITEYIHKIKDVRDKIYVKNFFTELLTTKA